MYLSRFLSLHALWVTVSSVMQHYPSVWGHYDVCKTQIYTEDGKFWDYTACQPEAIDMMRYVKVNLEPPDITCGNPPENVCGMVRQTFPPPKYCVISQNECLLSSVLRPRPREKLCYIFCCGPERPLANKHPSWRAEISSHSVSS